MRKHALVGGAPTSGYRGEQGGVEPTSVLVAAFEVKIRPPAQAAIQLDHAGMADAGVKPDIQDIFLFGKLLSSTPRTTQIGRSKFGGGPDKPGIRPLLFENRCDVLTELLAQQGLVALLAVENRYRHAPGALTGNTPVRPALQHAADALPAPRRNPSDVFDSIQGSPPQIVLLHGNKPLLRGAKDHRFLTAPAVGIAVGQFFLFEESVLIEELLNDFTVRLKNRLPRKVAGLGGELSLRVHRR